MHGVAGFAPTWASPLRLPHLPGTLTYARALWDDGPYRRVWRAGETRLDVIRIHTAAATVAYRLSHRDQVIFAGQDLVTGPPESADDDDAIRRLIYLLATHDPDALGMTPAQRRFIDQHGEDLCRALAPPPSPYPAGTRVIDSSGRRGTVRYLAADDGHVLTYAWRPDLAEVPGHPWHNLPYAAVISAAGALQPTIDGVDVGLERWTPAQPLAYGALVTLPTAEDTATVTATVIRSYRTPGGIVYQLRPHNQAAARVVLPAMALTPIRGTAWPTLNAMIEARDAAGILHDPHEIIDGALTAPPRIDPPGRPASAIPPPAATVIAATSQVRDSTHGLIEAPVGRFIAALSYDRRDLHALLSLHDAATGITGAEPTTTLAALVARHAPIPLDQPPEVVLEEPYPRIGEEPDFGLPT